MEDPNDETTRLRLARKLFDKAMSLPPAKRAQFVKDSCGSDAKLRDEVQRLLAGTEEGNSEQLRESARTELAAPTKIGVYKILDTLGEGGMGVVYLAEQREPMRRRVALKVMKPGLDSKSFLARFEAERQAMAMMEHTCIAKVFDAGLTEGGLPFLVMEHVKGVPITDYCDDHKLSIAQRVELFVMVCSAIQHAHTKGVMHRDLKPSNILVSVQDGEPHPKVIDFGLAKAVDHRLVEGTVFTEKGQLIGTPEYMSPEQAGVGGLDIDTRTDVFSLGVLLYELLTGTLPVTREELLKHGWFEMQRFIRDGELQKPSTKVTTLGAGAVAFAKARRIPLGDLQKQLRGELDWIVMKSIEKDRGRRYTTAHELAADLLRHLKDEPVSAGPPSARYLLSKVLRRYRGVAVTGAAVFVALGVGLGVALWQRGEALKLQEVAEGKTIEANQATAMAEEHRQRALDMFDKYERLADAVRLRALERRAAALWPEGDANKTAMAKWVEDAQTWLDGMPDHAATLIDLRRRGTNTSGEWTFDNPSAQFLHDALSDLVPKTEAFRGAGGLLAQVTQSRDWSQAVYQQTITDRADEWRRAKDELRSHPDFADLPLKTQEGLIPLGTNKQGYEEFWFVRSGALPAKEADGDLDPASGIVFVLLPGGTARIGSEDSPFAMPNEQPQRDVPLDPFFISKYETTQAQWMRMAGVNPSRYQATWSGAHPVELVSWQDIDAVLIRYGLQLPTEVQWEYACRAGTPTQWWFGDAKADLVKDGKGLFNAASGKMPEAKFWADYQDGFDIHTKVGAFEPNGFGLFDMHGNAGELTRSPGDSNYKGLKFQPGDGMTLGVKSDRVIMRGGSYWKRVEDARSSCRTEIDKRARYDNIGFRLVRRLER